MKSPLLFVALDDLGDKEQETLDAVRELDQVPGNFGYKINLDCLMTEGVRAIIRKLPASRPIFADTKTWNGKRTLTDLAKMLVDAGVDYFNVWVQADDQLVGAVKATEGSKTKILGVTVLTHYSDDWCRMYFRRSLEETVAFLTHRAKDLGLHGVVLPGTCLPAVKDSDRIKTVPGIRMEDFKDDRHKQEVTPEFAAQNGAHIVVCGSPIMKVSDKANALRQVLSRLTIAS
jgi:orotidine-5'-phosphate decarboxylase